MEDRANILRQMRVCRFCLANEEQNLLNIHEKLPQNNDITIPLPSLSLQIMACIAIEVVRNDGMPQYICKSCCHLTTQAYIFKTNCKKADDALKLFLVTGQLSKPYMQNVVQIKVQPTSEKFIKVVHDNKENEEIHTVTASESVDKESAMEIEMESDAEDEGVDESDTNSQSKTQAEGAFCFSCDQCDRSFPLQQLLDLHMINHTRERTSQCEICKNKFYNKYDLQKHALTHSDAKDFACAVCNKTFNREAFLRRHERTHEDVPKFCCTQCDKTFLTQYYLDCHMQKHNKRRPFTCKVCNKSFVFKQGLERHELIHSNNKPYKCNYCEASFISPLKLTRHITSHAGLRPYPCKLCGRTFLLSHHLTRHMRSHYAASTSLESAVGQFKCDICSMSFKKKDSLINHSAIHSMVNLKCVICNTTFETANLVKEHITTHLASLPFACDRCDYSFESEEQLEEHELKHAEMEYEEQIEKELFSESLGMQPSPQRSEEENGENHEVEEGEVEVSQYTIRDLANPTTSLNRLPQEKIVDDPLDNNRNQAEDKNQPHIEFLKDEVNSEDEDEEESIGEEFETIENESIKPIVRQEGTKVYQRKNVPVKPAMDIRLSSLRPSLTEKPRRTTLPESISADLTTVSNKTVKMGEKVVKVQKFILTKDEMKSMAKQGILEIKGGQVVLKSGGQQILNATWKPIEKNEIDSLLDKRGTTRMQLKRYEKKSLPDSSAENVST